MKKFFAVVGVAMVGLIAAPALADAWTPYFQIGYMDNDDGAGTGRVTLVVANAAGAIPANPGNCSNTNYAVMTSGANATSKDLMNKVLLGAFLSGRKVKLRLTTTCSVGNYPQFYVVAVDSTQ